jgi:hypothetical protein
MISVHEAGTILVCLFFAVTFLQSGFDKVADAKGNRDYFQSHFQGSPLAGMVPLLLTIITAMEIATGLICVAGAMGVFIERLRVISAFAILASLLTLLCLFAGQRIAKDYPGAATLAAYFIVGVGGLLLLPNEMLTLSR